MDDSPIIVTFLSELLSRFIANEAVVSIGVLVLSISLVGALCWIVTFLAQRLVLRAVNRVAAKSKTQWDDILLREGTFRELTRLLPGIVVFMCAPFFSDFSGLIQRFAMVYMLLVTLRIFSALLKSVNEVYLTFPISKEKPIKSYLQVVTILVYVIIGIFVVSTLINRDPWAMLTGLGAMTAILMMVFKDSILGFVAGIQLAANNMIRVGDWIEMAQYGADGDVVDITLHTVKVQNWDKTISTIPTYSLISGSFKNWRGMSESGGRRIKRSINIDMSTVKFCTSEMVTRYRGITHIAEYMDERAKEVDAFNTAAAVDTAEVVNGRRLTNLGSFRAYVVGYLKSNPKIHENMTFLVRQLAPTEAGLPIEIYVFSNDQVWASYEDIQADIFDHILAIIPEFDLRVFQHPTGADFQSLST